MIASPEYDRLVRQVAACEESDVQLRQVFGDAVVRLGSAQASRLWWAVFAAHDAAET